MTILPGWNSLDRATDFYRIFETAGVVALLASFLFGAGFVAYGRRKDELQRLVTEQKEASQIQEIGRLRAQAEDAERRVRLAEGTAAQARADAAVIDAKYAPRRLTAEQESALKQILAGHSGLHVHVHSVAGDAETVTFGTALARVIRDAGWPAEHENMAFLGAPDGLEVRIPGDVGANPKEVRPEDTCPAAARVLARALASAGHPARLKFWPQNAVEPGMERDLELVIGYKRDESRGRPAKDTGSP